MKAIHTGPFFLLLFLSFISPESSGQTFKSGLIGGIVTSQVGGDSYSGFNKLGLTVGGFVRYGLSEKWSAQFEIAYVQKGSRNDFSISENDPSQASEFFLMRLNYIEIPLLIKFSHRNFVYEAGLYYGSLVGLYMEYRQDNGRVSGPYENLDEFNQQLIDNGETKLVKDYDFGGMVGLAYKITDNILGLLRISTSFIPIKEFEVGQKDYYPTHLRLGYTNSALTATLRYTFGQGDEVRMTQTNTD